MKELYGKLITPLFISTILLYMMSYFSLFFYIDLGFGPRRTIPGIIFIMASIFAYLTYRNIKKYKELLLAEEKAKEIKGEDL